MCEQEPGAEVALQPLWRREKKVKNARGNLLASLHCNLVGFFSLVLRIWLRLARLTQYCHSASDILDRVDDHLY